MEKNKNEYSTIDIKHIFIEICKKIWVVILSAVIVGGAGFAWSSFAIAPKYSATIKLYVNNVSDKVNGGVVSSTQILAAQELVKTYKEILHSRPTYERIIEELDGRYTSSQMNQIITSGSVNDTEIMYITVTTGDPYEAATIANCIADVFPGRLSEVITNASVEVFEDATPNTSRVSPSVTTYTALGIIIGAFLAVAVIVITTLLDKRLHDESYVVQNYDYPILARIPGLSGTSYSESAEHSYKTDEITDKTDN